MEFTEIEERILVELEWAGEENLPTLMNTILDATGIPSEIDLLREALERLVQKNLVAIAVDRDRASGPVGMTSDAAFELVKNIEQHVAFNTAGRHWTGGRRPWPNVVSTLEGKARGRQIMDRRGYQWWRGKA